MITSSDVSVDCAHHVVNGDVTISRGISRVSIVNCVIPDYVSNPTNLTGLTIANSTLSNTLVINNAQNAIIRGNRISTDRREGAVLLFRGGSGNRVVDNVLDGGYHGHDLSGQGNDTTTGADDGILLDNETGDIVQGNTIINVYDAGVEGIDSVTGTTIADNTITGAIVAGIASYWCTHWEGDTISTNTISQSRQAITVEYTIGNCDQTPVPSGAFADNTIADNVLRNQLQSGSPGISIVLPSIADKVSNNLIRGNDVASANIFVLPLPGFMNGGGNVCGANGNFAC
jgi:hypothetical protein